MFTLPPNTKLITSPQVWMDVGAVDQLIQVASLPECKKAVGMPDLHQGRGIPVGAVFAFTKQLRPALIGGDVGCGVRVVSIPHPKKTGNQLLRRIEKITSKPALPDVDAQQAIHRIWHRGAHGLADLDGVPESLQELASFEPIMSEKSGLLPENAAYFVNHLGTAGGGNHFLEIAQVKQIVNPQVAQSLHLKKGGMAVVAHSGSRGLGGVIAQDWAHKVLDTSEEQQHYYGLLIGAVKYAQANRLILAWQALDALGCARMDRIGGSFDVVHNHVFASDMEGIPVWIHRKGAAPADQDQLTVVLGSRGTLSWIMQGQGCTEALCSVAHGAGRKWGRNEAMAKLKPRFKKESLKRTALGGHVICEESELLYEEHPKAYKEIEPIIQSIEQAGVARSIASLAPIITVKRPDLSSK